MEFTYILYMGEAIALTVMLGVIAIPSHENIRRSSLFEKKDPNRIA